MWIWTWFVLFARFALSSASLIFHDEVFFIVITCVDASLLVILIPVHFLVTTSLRNFVSVPMEVQGKSQITVRVIRWFSCFTVNTWPRASTKVTCLCEDAFINFSVQLSAICSPSSSVSISLDHNVTPERLPVARGLRQAHCHYEVVNPSLFGTDFGSGICRIECNAQQLVYE